LLIDFLHNRFHGEPWKIGPALTPGEVHAPPG